MNPASPEVCVFDTADVAVPRGHRGSGTCHARIAGPWFRGYRIRATETRGQLKPRRRPEDAQGCADRIGSCGRRTPAPFGTDSPAYAGLSRLKPLIYALHAQSL